MSAATLPPPRPPACLTRSYTSRGIKGGTLIAEQVTSHREHEDRLRDPDGYRPERCSACQSRRVHAHCLRERKLRPARASGNVERVVVRLFRCAEADCGAVFTVLPAFVARHLWRAWKTVEEVTTRPDRAAPRRTLRRWLRRLACDPTQLIELVAMTVRGAVSCLVTRRRPTDRQSFVDAITRLITPEPGTLLAKVAGWIHRLERGIRLM